MQRGQKTQRENEKCRDIESDADIEIERKRERDADTVIERREQKQFQTERERTRERERLKASAREVVIERKREGKRPIQRESENREHIENYRFLRKHNKR